MALDPTLRDKLAQTIHDAACRCGGPIHHRHYLAAADKAAELLTASPPYRFPDGWERGHEAKYWAQTGLTPYGLTLDPERAPGVLDLIASRVHHWVPVEPGTVIKAGTRIRMEWDATDEDPTEAAEGTSDRDVTVDPTDPERYYIDPATVPAEPEDPRVKRAHAIIPALQRVKNVPLGGDLLPAALEAIDALDALEADR